MLNNAGLRRFKTGWGTDEKILNYYRYDLRRNTFVTNALLPKGTYRRIFRIMPIFLLRMIGALLYKHVA
jgi:hypothetical protein